MKSLARMLAVTALLIAMTGNAAVTTFGGEVHPSCVSKQHDCGRPTTITGCCCGDDARPQMQSAPLPSRIDVRTDLSSIPAMMNTAAAATTGCARTTVLTSPPHRHRTDLPTLFSSFLI